MTDRRFNRNRSFKKEQQTVTERPFALYRSSTHILSVVRLPLRSMSYLFMAAPLFLVALLMESRMQGLDMAKHLVGRLPDASGASIVGATITIREISTGITLGAKSSPHGSYIFESLPASTFGTSATRQRTVRTPFSHHLR